MLPITRRLPQDIIDIIDRRIEELKPMPQAAWASIAPKLFKVIASVNPQKA